MADAASSPSTAGPPQSDSDTMADNNAKGYLLAIVGEVDSPEALRAAAEAVGRGIKAWPNPAMKEDVSTALKDMMSQKPSVSDDIQEKAFPVQNHQGPFPDCVTWLSSKFLALCFVLSHWGWLMKASDKDTSIQVVGCRT
uniref:Uncharacterized protein n=1 Tax=Branchiostoma floridae TaxID=7739 RepID=C3YBM9_BRAFL|eukprot:XP_002606376.1 hypothetical protein BRAFLDRAFT_67621 [Branchiostoma floridae]